MKTIRKTIFVAIFALTATLASAQVYPRTPRHYDFELSAVAKSITPVLSFNKNMHPDGWLWKEGRSSALVENGKPADFYEINKIDDVNMDIGEYDTGTAWVEGVTGDGIGEWVIIPIRAATDDFETKIANGETCGKLDIDFFLCNGYQQSLDLYYKNNRVKDARISIYAAAYSAGQDDAYLLWNPDCIYGRTITLNDDVVRNPICLNIHTENFSVTLPEKYRKEHCELYLKLEIRSVYKGSKYSDTCISHMNANVREAAD